MKVGINDCDPEKNRSTTVDKIWIFEPRFHLLYRWEQARLERAEINLKELFATQALCLQKLEISFGSASACFIQPLFYQSWF
jgi:hypothetical protein